MPETRVKSHPRKGTRGVKAHSRTTTKTGTVPHNVEDELLIPEEGTVERKEGFMDLLKSLLFSFFDIEMKQEPIKDLIKFDEQHNTALIKDIDKVIPLDDYKKVNLKDFTVKERVMEFEGRAEEREYYDLEGTGFDKTEIDQFLVFDSVDNHEIFFKKGYPLIIKSTDNDYSILRAPVQLK